MSVNYKKLYSYLVGQIDDALTLLDAENIFQYYRVKDILENALLTAEEMYLDAEDDE
ncbi:MAG: hypothetical protein IKC03_10040 [Oscillospiraceae bacterium]|nr:hypothetical protein [Oscillospiraceae bacterium]